MKILSNVKNSIFQILTFVVGVLAAFLLFSEYSCNRAKISETKSIVSQLNDSKFEKIKDQENAAFLVASAEIYLREIKLGQLVQRKASQTDVRELGKMNEEFNTNQLMSLIKLAKVKSVSIPTSPNFSSEETYTHLANQTGQTFDNMYCDEMIANQSKSIRFFEKIISETNDKAVKDFATESLPEMEQLLSYAMMCQKHSNK